VLFSDAWKAAETANFRAPVLRVFRLQRDVSVVLALKAASYILFLELPEDTVALRRFALALDRRFGFFFENAATDAELSFPSFVEY